MRIELTNIEQTPSPTGTHVMHTHRRAFTIIELLVVVSIITLLIGILLPAIGQARQQAKVTQSRSNLRQLAIAHGSYAADHNDRQLTFINDTISNYGNDTMDAFFEYAIQVMPPPPIEFGRGPHPIPTQPYAMFVYFAGETHLPISFENRFGSFRFINAVPFNQYLGGRYLDPVFYAPADDVVGEVLEPMFESPWEIVPPLRPGDSFSWSSYVLSPAAMYHPGVFSSRNGWKSPWKMVAGLRCPSFSEAQYPELKSHMLEHHWLQNRALACNAAFSGGSYDGCEPYYFNHAQQSRPVTLFYDGHIDSISVPGAESDNARQLASSGRGLWSADTPFGSDGYFAEQGYDFSSTSFHVFTSDGIRGRDVVR